jgi:hypothetical protein
MDMGSDPALSMAARGASCCVKSQAPLPESNTETSKTAVPENATTSFVPTYDFVNSEKAFSEPGSADLSPPPLQSLLCTFLI